MVWICVIFLIPQAAEKAKKPKIESHLTDAGKLSFALDDEEDEEEIKFNEKIDTKPGFALCASFLRRTYTIAKRESVARR